MALIKLTTIDAVDNDRLAAAQTQQLKTSLARVGGVRVLPDPDAASEPGAKSGPASALSFAMDIAMSPHTISTVAVLLFEFLRHSMKKSVELMVEGDKIVIEHGSHKSVQELVDVLERKLMSRGES